MGAKGFLLPNIDPATGAMGCRCKVDNLFWMDSKQWNVPLLSHLFSLKEVALISRILLNLKDSIDRQVWHYDRHGKFTVQSAYHVARGFAGQ